MENRIEKTSFYNDLIGFTIIGAYYIKYDDVYWPCLLLQNNITDETKELIVSQDPEGNGPGEMWLTELGEFPEQEEEGDD